MDAAVVVLVDVVSEVALEAGEADVEVAGEGRPPALLEDQPVERFDGGVCLWSAGADQGVLDAEPLECGPKVARAELAAVVAEDPLQPPACAGEVGADPSGELRGLQPRLGGRWGS